MVDCIQVAREVLDLYARLPGNGKPRTAEEFTVLAAFVARHLSTNTYEVLTLATGTKCVGDDLIDPLGCVVHDSHAEVLARRALLRLLMDQVAVLQQSNDNINPDTANSSLIIESNKISSPDTTLHPFKMKEGLELYLYISDSPCGDACIYSTAAGNTAFTGAKLVSVSPPIAGTKLTESTKACETCIREFGEQRIEEVRTKSGRSDIRMRTSSMSCSDKICRWLSLGVEGAILHELIGRIELNGIIIGGDPASSPESQLAALQRALVDRRVDNRTPETSPHLYILPCDEQCTFTHAKSVVKHKFENKVDINSQGKEEENPTKRVKKISPIPFGNSLNFIKYFQKPIPQSKSLSISCGGSIEVTIAHTGLPQGSTAAVVKKQLEALVQQSHLVTVQSQTNTIDNSTDLPNSKASCSSSSNIKVLCSRLSRFSMAATLEALAPIDVVSNDVSNCHPCITAGTYEAWKLARKTNCTKQEKIATDFFGHPIFSKWIRGSKEKAQLDA